MAKLNTKNLIIEKPQKLDREKIVKTMLSYHEPAFSMLKDSNPSFYPKNSFIWSGDEHVSLMKKELLSSVFYTELVNEDYTPKDPNRTLYKFRGNVNYIHEYYGKVETGPTGEYTRYFVPLYDFEKVDLSTLFQSPKETIEPPVQDVGMVESKNIGVTHNPPIIDTDDRIDDEDALMSKLTIRDHAAIQWTLPVSKKEWLNKLIKQINGTY